MIKTLILAILLLGCVTDGDYSEAKVVTIDGCEYIVTEGGVCHKGNCKNPIHEENE